MITWEKWVHKLKPKRDYAQWENVTCCSWSCSWVVPSNPTDRAYQRICTQANGRNGYIPKISNFLYSQNVQHRLRQITCCRKPQLLIFHGRSTSGPAVLSELTNDVHLTLRPPCAAGLHTSSALLHVGRIRILMSSQPRCLAPYAYQWNILCRYTCKTDATQHHQHLCVGYTYWPRLKTVKQNPAGPASSTQ